MPRSVKEIAKELETNKNVVYRIIKKHNLEPVPNDDKDAPTEYSDRDFYIIQGEYKTLQARHKDAKEKNEKRPLSSSDRLIQRYETEINRLNMIIAEKDARIEKLTDQLAEINKANHLETVRYQELLAREQNTKLLLTAQAQSRFNLFKPSTWKRHKPETPDLEPLTKDESDSQV